MRFFLYKIIALIILASFCCDTACFGLANAPASQNGAAKRSITAVLERTRLIYADTERAKDLLAMNGTPCLLLSCGRYLVSPEIAEDDITLLRAITNAEVRAVLKIIQAKDRARYQTIKQLTLHHFPPADTALPYDRYVEDTLATAFEWISLVQERVANWDDIPDTVRPFIEQIEPIVAQNTRVYFTAEFWDADERDKAIRQALRDGMVFYRPARRTRPAAAKKQCLILDGDGVLWGGAVLVGNASPEPRHLALQRAVKKLVKEQGVILVLNSTNDLDTVKRFFFDHPDMPLKLNDFRKVKVALQDKGTMIQEISAALGVEPGKMVFVDNSRLERVVVKKALPDIMALGMPTTEEEAGAFLDPVFAPVAEAAPDALAEDDAGQATVLMDDLIAVELNEDRIYEIRYDISRLTLSQRELVETYIAVLKKRTKTPENIKARPVAGGGDAKKPLFSVTCRAGSFTGEGRVNLAEQDLGELMMRLVPMMNMAIAASSIPDCATAGELDTYRPLISYIRNQFRAATGSDIALPDSPADLMRKIRNIALPKPQKIDTRAIEEYNRAAIAALIAA